MVVQTRRRKALQETAPEDQPNTTQELSNTQPSPSKKKRGSKANAPKEDAAESRSEPAKGTLMVFGDDDEEEVNAPVEDEATCTTAGKQVQVEEEEEEEDSDDEAPEAVSTAKAAEEIKKSTQAAQKAVQEQAAAQKRKRQQLAELLKKQAEERKKAEEHLTFQGEGKQLQQQQQQQPSAKPAEPSTSRARNRADRSNIPAVLPAEFLTDSSSEDDEEDGEDGAAAGPKRRKVSGVEKRLTRLDAGPKDEVVKSTVYRVEKKMDQRLAPKVKKHSKASKELLLKRNRAAVTSGSGFLKKK
ncbi:hypothetical protein A9Z42_0050120 [Trichoderma parareesei]|uniref:U3 snoRNA associated n=1 Tax=Trichoderma parareesei TaxID=858221 RepID=A0A2H2ZUR7_TRIPA|nr:hypothetical protein A9Z42_0050120 [Trichoderma parareesei]